MSSAHPSDEDMTSELRLQQEDLLAQAGPAAGSAFEAIYNWNPDPLDNDSDDEEEDWSRRGRYADHRGAENNALEADGSDTGPEPVSQSGVPSNYRELQRRVQAEEAQGHVSEATRDVFEEYFGDRYRIVTPPNGRGWQNQARLTAAQRISRGIYGRSINAVRDTTLEQPDLESASPPPGLCASRRALQRRRDAITASVMQERALVRSIQAYEDERQTHQEMGRPADQYEDALLLHRRSNDLEALRTELNARAMFFKEENPAAFDAWADHITVAHSCSTSKSRQHQIIQWYTRGVPGRVLRQVRRVELYYTMEAHLRERLLQSQVRTGARRAPDMRYHAKDDDNWAGNVKKLFFGYDPEKSVNGFQDYVPKGEGAAKINHLMVNFTARKVRLEHASRQHFSVVAAMLSVFVNKALLVLSGPEYVGGVDQYLLRRTRESLDEYRLNPIQYRPERDDSSSAFGTHRADGHSSNDGDGSDVEAIANGIPNAARVLAGVELGERDRVREIVRAAMENWDEEDTDGNVPPDDEDEDELMDDSSD